MKFAIKVSILLFLFVGISQCITCVNNEVVINGVCTPNDVAVPQGATTSYHGSKRITLQIAQTPNDPKSLDFLITMTTVDNFFLVFGDTYINSDTAVFQVIQQADKSYIVTVVDSFYQKPYPELPVSDSDLGGQQNIVLLGYQVINKDEKTQVLLIKIRRQYDTSDQYDTLFTSDKIQLQRCLFGSPQKQGDAFTSWYVGSFFFVLNAVSKPCNGENQIFDGANCITNDLAMPAKQYIAKSHADDFLFINYEINQDTSTITMLLTAKTNGYFGIGWGSNLMSLMDMTIVNVNNDNPDYPIAILDDSFSISTGSPKYDTMLGGTYDLKVLGYKVEASQVTLKFSRLLKDNDVNYDFQFNLNQEVPFAFAFSPSTGVSLTLTYHQYSVGWGTLVLQAADATSCAANGQVYINNQCVQNDISATGLTQSQSFNNKSIKLQYGITDDDLTILFTIQNIGWFGFGFDQSQSGKAVITQPEDMTQADIIIFDTVTLQDGSLSIYIQDTFANKNIVPNLDTSIGGTEDVILLGYLINQTQGTTQVKVQRKLNTGDKYDYQFVKNTQVGVIFAWMSKIDNIQYHGNNAGTDILNFFYTPTTCPAGQILVKNVCQLNDIAPLTSSAKDSFLDFQFSIIDESITIMLVIQNTGWFGLGFGSNMNDVDMIIVTSNEGVVTVSDDYSSTTSQPKTDLSLGGQDNVTLLGYQITSDTTTVKFTRLLNTKDKYDAILVPNLTLTIVYAWGSSNQMSYHENNFAGATFPLKEGYKGNLDGLEFNDITKKMHFWSNFVLWGFLVDIAFFAARFFKTGRYYKEIHGSIMGIIVIFTAFVEIWMVIEHDILFNDGLSSYDNMMRAHAIMGFIFLIFFILEAFGGSFLNYLLSFKNTGDRSSLQIKSFHKYFGYLLYIIGKINVFLGVRIIEDSAQQTACISGYTLFIVLRFVMEYLYRKQPKIFSKILFLSESESEIEKISSTHSLLSTKEGFSNLVDMINNGKTTEEIQKANPNLEYVLFKDNIYSINKINHPGGKFIFNSINGRDISRFMFGAYGIENSNMPAHTHSPYSIQLMKQHQVGILQQANILSEPSGQQHIWTIKKEKNLSQTTSLFYLESHSRVKVNNQQKGMEWFGRHFTLSDINNEKSTRIYTNCLSFTPFNMALFEKLQSNFNLLISNQKSTIDNQLPPQSLQLPLVIKRYESPTGFSQFVHDFDSQDQALEVRVEGPHGRGLEISEKSQGLHLIISGGTGIVPFYDLLIYYSKYLMYKALEKKYGESVAKQSDFANENFKRYINKDFKIKVISAFNSADDDNGALQLLEFMKKIDIQNNLNLFDVVVAVKGYKSDNIIIDTQYFTQQYIGKHIDNLIVQRAFVCGPPGLNKNVPLALEALGLNKQQIMLV